MPDDLSTTTYFLVTLHNHTRGGFRLAPTSSAKRNLSLTRHSKQVGSSHSLRTDYFCDSNLAPK